MKSKLDLAKRERDRAERELAVAIADLDAEEQKLASVRERDPKDEERRHELHEKARKQANVVRAASREVREREGALRKAKRAVKRAARRARNRVKPKYKDLKLPARGSMARQTSIVGSVGHYTAGAAAEDDEQAVRLWRLVDAQHKAQDWAMIGYNLGLGPDGGVYGLRPIEYVGAHTLGYNTGRVGFSVHGTTGDTWTKPQLRALRWALKRFGLRDKPVWGHNDFNPTGCPGDFKPGYVSKGRKA